MIKVNNIDRIIYFQDKYKNYDERNKIINAAITEVKAAIKNEDELKKKIYKFILSEEGHARYADEDAKTNVGYLDSFYVREEGNNGWTIDATIINYQYMITNLKNGNATSDSKVIYLD